MINWLVLAVLLLWPESKLHEYYVSVFEVAVVDRHTIELSGKLFTDDLELALSEYHGVPVRLDTMAAKNGEKWVLPYLKEHLKFTGGEQEYASWKWVGLEADPDLTYVFLESRLSNFPQKISLKFTVFFDQYPTQVNIVHLSHKGKQRSAMMTLDQPKTELQF